jgi:hypothetical protein
VKTGADGENQSADLMTINRPDDLGDIANLGLTLAEGKLLLACRALPCRIAGRHRNHRRHSQFPGEPADEQAPTDALIATRCRSSASGSLRGLQWHTRFGFGQRFQPANDLRSQVAVAA